MKKKSCKYSLENLKFKGIWKTLPERGISLTKKLSLYFYFILKETGA